MIVEIEGWLADLVPKFLVNQARELERIDAAYAAGDFPGLKSMGHKLRGAAAGYGFLDLANEAAALEAAAGAGDRDAARAAIDGIARYLRTVQVVYR